MFELHLDILANPALMRAMLVLPRKLINSRLKISFYCVPLFQDGLDERLTAAFMLVRPVHMSRDLQAPHTYMNDTRPLIMVMLARIMPE